jgi:hypothetical protein
MDAEPQMRITKDLIGLNEWASKLMGITWGSHLEVLWDAETGKVGLRKADTGHKVSGKGCTYIIGSNGTLNGRSIQTPTGWLPATWDADTGIMCSTEAVPLH